MGQHPLSKVRPKFLFVKMLPAHIYLHMRDFGTVGGFRAPEGAGQTSSVLGLAARSVVALAPMSSLGLNRYRSGAMWHTDRTDGDILNEIGR